VAIVTRYVPGVTLRAALRGAGGPFAYARAAAVLRDLAAALAYAHARRIVHRDVKPENVFLEEPGGRALLADFGIARPLDVDSPLTVDGASMGTPTYMAPEQITGRAIDERTDVYALGLVGWEMLAGRRPWQGETLYAVLHRQQHDELPDLALLRPDIPAYLLAAVRGALAKDPAARWRDGAEFLARLTPAPVALPRADAARPRDAAADQTPGPAQGVESARRGPRDPPAGARAPAGRGRAAARRGRDAAGGGARPVGDAAGGAPWRAALAGRSRSRAQPTRAPREDAA
jgi:serine/threonine-protein kinase